MYRPDGDVQYLQPQGYSLCFLRLLTLFVINKSGLNVFCCLLFFIILILHTRPGKAVTLMYAG